MRSINSRHICVVQLSDLASTGGVYDELLCRGELAVPRTCHQKRLEHEISSSSSSLQSSTHPAPSRSHGSSEDDTCRRRSFIRFLQTMETLRKEKCFRLEKLLFRLTSEKGTEVFCSDSLPKGSFWLPEAPAAAASTTVLQRSYLKWI